MKCCKDCVFSIPMMYSNMLRCKHYIVVKQSNNILYSSEEENTVPCKDARMDRRWNAPCGIHGFRFQSK